MEFKKIYLTVSVIALTCSQYAVASPLNNISHTHTQHTLELKPISASYQIAASTFLPDYEDGLDFSGKKFDEDRETAPQIDLCSKFSLSACPANSKCSKCPTDNKFKLNGCNDGFKLSAGTCVALTCTEINSAYRADVPVNQVCSTVSTYSKTCYQTCKAIDFSGYPVTTCPDNTTCADHPDCATTAEKKGNCSPIKKKVTTCTLPSQKVNSTASGCINKDDTCPESYFKTCETDTTGDPKYTELGSACYQCTAKVPPMAMILYSDMTTAYEVMPAKTPIGVVVDSERHKAISLNEFPSNTYYWTKTPDVVIPNLPDYIPATNDDSEYSTKTHTIRPETMTGKTNTGIINTHCGNNCSRDYPVFYQVSQYTTPGTSKNDWYLPSPSELASAFKQITPINATLALIGSPLLKTGYNGYWTSSFAYTLKGSSAFSWTSGDIQTATANNYSDYTRYGFRVFLDYDTTDYKYSCSGDNSLKGASNPRNGKYSACICKSNYNWNPISGNCEA